LKLSQISTVEYLSRDDADDNDDDDDDIDGVDLVKTFRPPSALTQ